MSERCSFASRLYVRNRWFSSKIGILTGVCFDYERLSDNSFMLLYSDATIMLDFSDRLAKWDGLLVVYIKGPRGSYLSFDVA